MKNSFRIISAILLLIAFCCSSVISFAQSNSQTFKDAYSIQKDQQNKYQTVSIKHNSRDVIIENELEDNEESASDSDFCSDNKLFSTCLVASKTSVFYPNRKLLSLNILYCVFRI